MITFRSGTFETNSSSTHTIVIDRRESTCKKITPLFDSDGYFIINPDQDIRDLIIKDWYKKIEYVVDMIVLMHGWDEEKVSVVNSKLVSDEPELMELLRRVVEIKSGYKCTGIRYYSNWENTDGESDDEDADLEEDSSEDYKPIREWYSEFDRKKRIREENLVSVDCGYDVIPANTSELMNLGGMNLVDTLLTDGICIRYSSC